MGLIDNTTFEEDFFNDEVVDIIQVGFDCQNKRKLICEYPSIENTIPWLYVIGPEPYGLTPNLIGKWVVFIDNDQADWAWQSIRQEVIDGNLGISAKVATLIHARKGKHVICVYTYDFHDSNDVMRVLNRLKEIGICPNGYKTDEMTRNNVVGFLEEYHA